MNVRSGPGTEYDKLDSVTGGMTFPAILSLSNKEWLAIQYDADTVAYLYHEFATLVCNQKEAMTLAEIAAAERAAKIEKAHVKSVPVTYRDPITVSDEDFEVFVLVVAAEAYWEPYEGQLAVANVILNRLLTDSSCDTIYDVVTKPGQFEGYKHIDKYRSRDLGKCYLYLLAENRPILRIDTAEYIYFYNYTEPDVLNNYYQEMLNYIR